MRGRLKLTCSGSANLGAALAKDSGHGSAGRQSVAMAGLPSTLRHRFATARFCASTHLGSSSGL
jgi:hypothetical protein